jgi:hypothetical protein
VEAKALTTGDDVNIDQLCGGFQTVTDQANLSGLAVNIQQVAIRMIESGLEIAIFRANTAPVTPESWLRVKFSPAIENWHR